MASEFGLAQPALMPENTKFSDSSENMLSSGLDSVQVFL